VAISLKSDTEVAVMREGGRILAAILETLREATKSGVTTQDLELIAAREMESHKVKPSFKGYHGYPARLCVSVNDEVVHGIPGDRRIREGDIVSIDAGVIHRGFQTDAAITIPVGKVSDVSSRLITATEEALEKGISEAVPGRRLGAVSVAIQRYVEDKGFAVVREYTGHGIGRQLHEDPQVPNFGVRNEGPVLQKGMTIAIEPMVTNGDWHTRVADNQWTVLTVDGSLAAHFEHTVAIGENGAEILTAL
jgi:methionyl aminopeptidase